MPLPNDDQPNRNHSPKKASPAAKSHGGLTLNNARGAHSGLLPWALIPYHRARANRALARRFSGEEEWALTAVALAPHLPVPIDPFLRQTFGNAFQREPDPVLRWLGAVRDEESRIQSIHPVRHYLLWHVANIFDDADPVLEDPEYTLRRVSETYAVGPPDAATLTRETALIRSTLLQRD